MAKVRHRTSLGVLPKFTAIVEGRRRIVDKPPLIVHDAIEDRDAEKMLARYVESLPPDRRPLLERWTIVDAARKVVGVGSVGTRCYLVLLMDHDGRTPLFLQLKEAKEAVTAPHAGPSEFTHQGQRVVVGQRLMQAASDIFLGWTTDGGRHYYVRQFRDMKGSVNLDVMTESGFATYARLCGRVLARAHARSGDAAAIGGYLGRRRTFDEAVAVFADAYSVPDRTRPCCAGRRRPLRARDGGRAALITVAVDVETSDTIGVYPRLPEEQIHARAMGRASANGSGRYPVPGRRHGLSVPRHAGRSRCASQRHDGRGRIVRTHRRGRFLDEIGLFNGEPSFLTAVLRGCARS